MASLNLNHIYKVYPNGVKAVNDFCMDIEDKEFIVFVGPSGCGKSTTLRMIAGLEEITAGELRIGDAVVNDMEPKDRDIAMVFQNYALYPHMTVYDNMAFGLRLRHINDVKRDKDGNQVLDENGEPVIIKRKYTKQEIDDKVQEAARILGITEYLDRKPKAMSGGQRQRVALGRAIVREPKVFLLDEPLSNLDAKLRTAMRSEISKLHHKLKTTFIYVTHDQVEAMTMGTRIVVMKDGFIQQIDSPRNLYRFPGNKFVAGFIGTPQMNFFEGKLLLKGDKVTVSFDNTGVSLDVPAEYFHKTKRNYLNGEKAVTIGIRAEHVSVDPALYPFKAKCRVSHVEELGTDCQVYADFNIEAEEAVAESPTRVIVKAPAGSYYDVDEIIDVSLDMSHIHVFDSETEQTISPRIPVEVLVNGEVKGDVLSIMGKKIQLPSAIQAAEGQCEVSIPTAAISLGGDIDAEVLEEENVNGQHLVHLKVGNDVLFAIVSEENIGKKAKIAIDLKKITITQGESVVAPLADENSVVGKISKHKQPVEQVVDGKVKKTSELAFDLEICGAKISCPYALAVRLVNGGGQDIFNKDLEYRFTPYQVELGQEGIVAKVEKILDYGTEQFAVCSVTEKIEKITAKGQEPQMVPVIKQINIAVSKDSAPQIGEEIHIGLKAEDLAIVEVARSIRLA